MKNLHSAKYLILSVFTLLFFSACKKDYVDPLGDQGQKTIGFVTYGGKTAASAAVSALSLDLSLPKDSLELRLLYSTPQVSDKDITVTLFFDPAKLTAFNAAQPVGGIIYSPLSATQFKLKTTQVKIRAGQTLSDPFYVIFYNDQLDPANSYLLTLGISKIEGAPADVKPASGTGTAYLRIIGNPIAGAYNVVGTRYNFSGAATYSGPSSSTNANIPTNYVSTTNLGTTTTPVVKVASAIDPLTVTMSFSNLGFGTGFEYGYLIAGVSNFTNISVGYNSAFTSNNTIKGTYLMSYTPPSPTQKAQFRVVTHYNNNATGTGNDRIIDESFTHQ